MCRPPYFRSQGAEQIYSETIMRMLIAYLRHGALAYLYDTNIPLEGPASGEYGAFNHMYPITPVELHEGWILGKERIITAVSGVFCFGSVIEPEKLSFGKYLFLVPLGFCANALPISPAGLGVGEAAFDHIFRQMGSEAGAEVAAFFHLTMIVFGLWGLGLYVRKNAK
jgi:hypothetical protein